MKLEQFAEHRWGPKRRQDAGDGAHTSGKYLDAIATSAFDNLRTYSNCCRSTLHAVQVHLRLPDAGSLKACAALAGGIGGTGETCGAILGGLMAIGLFLGSDDPRDETSQEIARQAARLFVNQILDRYGSTRCHELQEALIGWRLDDPARIDDWRAAGGPIACATICAEAARDAAAIILDDPDSA